MKVQNHTLTQTHNSTRALSLSSCHLIIDAYQLLLTHAHTFFSPSHRCIRKQSRRANGRKIDFYGLNCNFITNTNGTLITHKSTSSSKGPEFNIHLIPSSTNAFTLKRTFDLKTQTEQQQIIPPSTASAAT